LAFGLLTTAQECHVAMSMVDAMTEMVDNTIYVQALVMAAKTAMQ